MKTTRREWFVRLVCLLVAVTSLTAEAGAKSPTEILEERGLVKDGVYWLHPSEEDVYKELEKVERYSVPLAAKFDELSEQIALARQHVDLGMTRDRWLAELKIVEERIPLLPQRNLDEQSVVANMILYKSHCRQVIHDLDGYMDAVKRNMVSPEDRDRLKRELVQRQKEFLQAAAELRPVYDRMIAAYKELSKDYSIKNALNVAGGTSKAPMKLGPSKDMESKIGRVKDIQRRMAGGLPDPRPKPKPKIHEKFKLLGSSRTK